MQKNCLNYYLELCKQITNRFDFTDKVLTSVQLINPLNLGDNISPLIALFLHIVEDNEIEEMDIEWKNLLTLGKCAVSEENRDDLEKSWSSAFNLKNGLGNKMFPKLNNFISAILYLPHSSAAAERVFSSVNLMKNKTRNRFQVETILSVMCAKEILMNYDQAYN